MWILPNHSKLSAFVQDWGVSTSEPTTASEDELASNVFVNEKAMRSASFSRKCKTDASLVHLFGLTLPLSLSKTFTAYLTLPYSGGSHVNPSRYRDYETRMPTNGTCFRSSNEASLSADLRLSCSKTWTASHQPSSQGRTRQVFSSMSWKVWKAWVTSQRRLRSAREKLEQGITEDGGSSSECWPTPTTAEDYGFAGTWQGFLARQAKFKAKGTNLQKKLDIAIQDPANVKTTHGTSLQDPTNSSSDGSSQEYWPTPRANKMEGSTNEGYGDCLMEAVMGRKGATKHKLSALWTAQLMGLPADWAILPPSWEPSTKGKS